MWNIIGLGTKKRKDEVRQLEIEKKIKIAGIMESRLGLEGLYSLQIVLGDEWGMVTNIGTAIEEDRVSILICFKKAQWSIHSIFRHKQIIHSCLTNVGGYEFDLPVVYGRRNASVRGTLGKIGRSNCDLRKQ